MKIGDIIITKDGIGLIAVPFTDNDALCNGCFFNKSDGYDLINKDLGIDC